LNSDAANCCTKCAVTTAVCLFVSHLQTVRVHLSSIIVLNIVTSFRKTGFGLGMRTPANLGSISAGGGRYGVRPKFLPCAKVLPVCLFVSHLPNVGVHLSDFIVLNIVTSFWNTMGLGMRTCEAPSVTQDDLNRSLVCVHVRVHLCILLQATFLVSQADLTVYSAQKHNRPMRLLPLFPSVL